MLLKREGGGVTDIGVLFYGLKGAFTFACAYRGSVKEDSYSTPLTEPGQEMTLILSTIKL
jgi:hypothetical protein